MEAWTVEFDLFVKGAQDEERCQLDRFELEHKTVREVDKLEERAVDVWRERAWHEAITATAGLPIS